MKYETDLYYRDFPEENQYYRPLQKLGQDYRDQEKIENFTYKEGQVASIFRDQLYVLENQQLTLSSSRKIKLKSVQSQLEQKDYRKLIGILGILGQGSPSDIGVIAENYTEIDYKINKRLEDIERFNLSRARQRTLYEKMTGSENSNHNLLYSIMLEGSTLIKRAANEPAFLTSDYERAKYKLRNIRRGHLSRLDREYRSNKHQILTNTGLNGEILDYIYTDQREAVIS